MATADSSSSDTSQNSLVQHLSVQGVSSSVNVEVKKKEQSKLAFTKLGGGGTKKGGGSLHISNSNKIAKRTPTKSTSNVTNKQFQMAIIKMVENSQTTTQHQSSKEHTSSTTTITSTSNLASNSTTGGICHSAGLSIPLMDQNELSRLLSSVTKTSPSKVSPDKQHRIPKKPKSTGGSSGGVKKRSSSLCSLPSNRVRMLMKTTPNVVSISQEAITVTSKAAELFISKLIQDSLAKFKESSSEDISSKEITYTHLAQSVKCNPQQMKFLKDFLPMKVKAKDYMATLKTLPGNSNTN